MKTQSKAAKLEGFIQPWPKATTAFVSMRWFWQLAILLAGSATVFAATNVPPPVVLSAVQRPGTTFMDIDYRVNDPEDDAVQTAALGLAAGPACAFEGRLQATVTQGGQASGLLYTVGTNQLRIEKTDTNWPHARNIVDRQTGALTLLFPHNRSFVRLKSAGPPAGSPFPRGPGMPLPPGIGPQPSQHSKPSAIGPTNLPGMPAVPAPSAMPAMPQMAPGDSPAGVGPQPGTMPGLGARPGMAPGMPAIPMMPMMPMGMMEKAELKATGEKTNLLGYACERFELKQRGEVMEIWATDRLFAFEPYQQNQPPRFGPSLIKEQWSELVKARKLFPLLASLKFENGPERLRFEVKAITLEKIEDRDGQLFQPPSDYHEFGPLPF